MKVKQLIKELKKHNGDLDFFVQDTAGHILLWDYILSIQTIWSEREWTDLEVIEEEESENYEEVQKALLLTI
jgi:hypothetical protein